MKSEGTGRYRVPADVRGVLERVCPVSVRGVIFDLDDTVIDSGLDFDAIRRAMQLPPGQPILETMRAVPDGAEKDRKLAILKEHELQGARRATLMPGIEQFLAELTRRGILQAILTRNSAEATTIALDRLDLHFSQVMTRADVPPKPDPTGLLRICDAWQLSVSEVLFFGDYAFDLQAGKNAGMRTVLYAPNGLPDYANEADFILSHYSHAVLLLDQID